VGGDLLGESGGVEHVFEAQAAAGGLIGIGGADAAPGGADLRGAAGALLGRIQGAVSGGDEMGGVGEAQAGGGQVDAGGAQGLDLLKEGGGVDDQAAADHADGVRVDHAGGDEVQLECLPAGGDGVAGVVSAVVAGDDVSLGGKQVDDAALAFIAPLGANDDIEWHGYAPDGFEDWLYR
jgi:hypothetical protein